MGKKSRDRKKKQQQQQSFQTMKSLSDVSAFGSGDDLTTSSSSTISTTNATTALSTPQVHESTSSSSLLLSTTQPKRFSGRELARLKSYLQEYKRMSLHGIDNSTSTPNSDSIPGSNVDFTTETKIGGIYFPPLVTLKHEVVPYISFSPQLSPKQRREVHRLAMEIGLFHSGYGVDEDSKKKRFVAVSAFSDGLKYLEVYESSCDDDENNINDNENGDGDDINDDITDIKKEDEEVVNPESSSIVNGLHEDDNKYIVRPFAPVRKYKPWICLKNGVETDRARDTQEGKELVYQLFDQPGMCLRDGLDRIDLDAMQGLDLSHRSSLESANDGSFLFVNSVETMRQCLSELRDDRPSELAFDVECYNKSKYVQVTCLLQLATNHGKDYVIDVLADDGQVWDMVKDLAEIFADASIVKVGHAIGGLDVQCLHRDFGIFVVNVFDTYCPASMLPKLSHHGLAKICRFYGLPESERYEGLKEKYQNSDWTRRPLPDPAVLYARYDVHYLLDLRKLLMRDLIKSDDQPYPTTEDYSSANKEFVSSGGIESMRDLLRSFNEEDGIEDDEDEKLELDFLTDDDDDGIIGVGEGDMDGATPKTILGAKDLRMNLALMAVISKSQDACLGLWRTTPEPPMKNPEYQSMLVQASKDGNPWTASQVALYEQMANWRERVAEDVECLAGFVCTLEFLACVAMKRPESKIGLRQILWHLPHILTENDGKYAKEILLMVQSSRSKDKLVPNTPFLTYDEYRQRRSKKKDGNFQQTVWMVTTVVAAVVAALAFRYMGKQFSKKN